MHERSKNQAVKTKQKRVWLDVSALQCADDTWKRWQLRFIFLCVNGARLAKSEAKICIMDRHWGKKQAAIVCNSIDIDNNNWSQSTLTHSLGNDNDDKDKMWKAKKKHQYEYTHTHTTDISTTKQNETNQIIYGEIQMYRFVFAQANSPVNSYRTVRLENGSHLFEIVCDAAVFIAVAYVVVVILSLGDVHVGLCWLVLAENISW